MTTKEPTNELEITHRIEKPLRRLSDPSMKKQMDTLRSRIKNDPSFARGLLHEAGIIADDGKLSKKVGG